MLRVARQLARARLAKEAEQDPEGVELRRHLRDEFAAGEIRASKLAILAYKIRNAGGQGVSDLACNPKCKHNASRKVANAFGLQEIEESMLLDVTVPLFCKGRKRAVLQKMSLLPFYEHLHRYFLKDERPFMRHIETPDLLCDNFYTHEVVQRLGPEMCFPLRLNFDFAQLNNKNSTLNVFVSCLHVKKRFPVLCLPKSWLCRCGCRGAHTLPKKA